MPYRSRLQNSPARLSPSHQADSSSAAPTSSRQARRLAEPILARPHWPRDVSSSIPNDEQNEPKTYS
jgi:hypothetical protein